MGTSTAFHLAERGVDTVLLDRTGPATGPTGLSAALVRSHYPTTLEADLAWESTTDYFERWGERVGGGCGFTRTGFAFLAAKKDAEKLASNVNMLKEKVGVETRLLGPEELAEIDPSITAADVALAAYEPRGGYADPNATAVGFLRAAEDRGARFERETVVSLAEKGGGGFRVETDRGFFETSTVFLCNGSWAVPLARGVGLDLPIDTARVQVALFERPNNLPTHLTMIDAVNEISTRPTADRCTLVGMRLSELEWVSDPDGYATELDDRFASQAAERIGRRIPALQGTSLRNGWAGVLDMTPDGRPVLGPEGPEGLYLCAGWSGKGFKKGPAVGAELARWASEGQPVREELSAYSLSRFEGGELLFGKHEYGVKSPH